jgi:2-keto-4-pentenoate hydratase
MHSSSELLAKRLAQGQTQAGDTAADNENIAGVLVGHGDAVVRQAGGGFAMWR